MTCLQYVIKDKVNIAQYYEEKQKRFNSFEKTLLKPLPKVEFLRLSLILSAERLYQLLQTTKALTEQGSLSLRKDG